MKDMAPQHDSSCREGNSRMHYDKLSKKKKKKIADEFREMLIIIIVYLGFIQNKKVKSKRKITILPIIYVLCIFSLATLNVKL